MSNSITVAGVASVDAGELPALFQLAKVLSQAGGFLPSHIKNEGELLACILAGRELGLGAMASIRGIRLIQGQVTLDAALQLGLMVRIGCKVRWLADGSNGFAELEVTRPGMEPHVSRFSMDDAQRAGLVKAGGNWAKYPAAMLRARCVSSAGKAYAPDVLAGVYLPDELDAADAPEPMPVRATVRDVSAPVAKSEPPPAADKPAAQSAEWTYEKHIKALDRIGKDKLQGWVERLFDMRCTAEQNEQAWLAFQAKCVLENVDPQSFVPEQVAS